MRLYIVVVHVVVVVVDSHRPMAHGRPTLPVDDDDDDGSRHDSSSSTGSSPATEKEQCNGQDDDAT